MDITFDSSSANFILECFPDAVWECGICGGKVGSANLAGVVSLDSKTTFICNSFSCLEEITDIVHKEAKSEIGAHKSVKQTKGPMDNPYVYG